MSEIETVVEEEVVETVSEIVSEEEIIPLESIKNTEVESDDVQLKRKREEESESNGASLEDADVSGDAKRVKEDEVVPVPSTTTAEVTATTPAETAGPAVTTIIGNTSLTSSLSPSGDTENMSIAPDKVGQIIGTKVIFS